VAKHKVEGWELKKAWEWDVGLFKQATEEIGGAESVCWPSFDIGIEVLQ
jgi:hypothetical protein